MQIVADMAPNQQGNERANLGLGAQGRHPLKVFVQRRRVQQFVRPFVAPPSHVLQAPVDLGWILAGVGQVQGFNLDDAGIAVDRGLKATATPAQGQETRRSPKTQSLSLQRLPSTPETLVGLGGLGGRARGLTVPSGHDEGSWRKVPRRATPSVYITAGGRDSLGAGAASLGCPCLLLVFLIPDPDLLDPGGSDRGCRPPR
jgi:hypothetical protein